MLGVSTIGNATLIAYDKVPILATDAWFGDETPAYFGSWTLNHEIPAEIKRDICRSKYIWFSHGHPDHLNPDSLLQLRGRHVLLADHVGGRIAASLRQQGFRVSVLPDRQWVSLSEKIRVLCVANAIQDSILLVDVNGHLFVDLNDAGTRNCTRFVKKIIAGFQQSYLLCLSGYGDADMINFYDESGKFVVPPVNRKEGIGAHLNGQARRLGINNVIPFSSFHAYQRADSVWAEQYVTEIAAYRRGFDEESVRYIPPFSHVDCVNGEDTPLSPRSRVPNVVLPEAFGDVWGDRLEKGELKAIDGYFRRKDRVRSYLSFINFRVGGEDNFIPLSGEKGRGITFEVPRNSLVKAVEYEIFDDLLIGNFMKTTLHNLHSLYDGDFNFFVTKYGDNGRAESEEQLASYFREYRRRAGREWLYDQFSTAKVRTLARLSGKYPVPYKHLRTLYRAAKKPFS